ncbi:MAG: G8 domain-containing protein, partial [Bacteroidales bacterium]
MQTREIYKQHIFALIVLVLFSFISQAATITATSDGNWADGTTWDSGTLPENGDDVIIPDSRTVTGTSISSSDFQSLTVTGTLNLTSNITINDDNLDPITITDGGTIHVGGDFEVTSTSGGPLTIKSGGSLEIAGQITTGNNDYTITNEGSIEVGGIEAAVLTLNNEIGASLLIKGNFASLEKPILNNDGIITVDRDLNLTKTILNNNSTGNIIVFGKITIGEGSEYTNSGNIQSINFEYVSNATDFINEGGTLVVIEDFIINGNCPTCDATTLGEFYFGNIVDNGSTWCGEGEGEGTQCEEFLRTGNEVSIARKLWLNASIIGYGQGNQERKIDRWFDLAKQYGFKMHQDDTTKQPSLKISTTNNLNFNPIVSYDDSNIFTILDDDDGEHLYFEPTPNNGYGVFAVIVPKSTGDQFVFDYGTYHTDGYGLMYSEDTYKTYSPTRYDGVESSVSHGQGAAPTIITQT